MFNSNRFLDEAFKDALQRATIKDENGDPLYENNAEFAIDGPASHVAMVEQAIEIYRDNHSFIDDAIRGAQEYLSKDENVAHVKALQGALDSPSPNPLSVQLSSEILNSSEFDALNNNTEVQGLQGTGIGVSAGASFFIGAFAGADIVFNVNQKAQLIPRAWAGLSFKSGVSIDLGLEFSFWHNKPIKGLIAGGLLDLSIIGLTPFGFFRFMYIMQKQPGAAKPEFSGISLQFPVGVGLWLRKKYIDKNKKFAGLLAPFGGVQVAAPRNERTSFEVIDTSTGLDFLTVGENPTTLKCTLKNTLGEPISLSASPKITIGMPIYFKASEIAAMTLTAPTGWTVTPVGNTFQLTYDGAYDWKIDEEIVFNIANVQTDNTPTSGQAEKGYVTLTLNDDALRSPIAKSAELDLFWGESQAKLTWDIKINTDDFTLVEGEASSGVSEGYAQPGNVVVTLTKVTQTSTNKVWVLGYIYNYNTALSEPQFSATWWKEGYVKQPNRTIFTSTPIVSDGSVTGYYGGAATSNGSSIEIGVQFDTSSQDESAKMASVEDHV